MLNPGEIIDGKYRIVQLLGEGGMGAVYEGDNTRIHRRVAIKVLHATLASNAETVARFEREAQAAGRIGSMHIVEVLDLGSLPNGDRYLVMEYLDGEGLGQRLRQRKRLSVQEITPIALQLLEGLTAAHGAGIIHRDLKPDNVFLLKRHAGQKDFVKLLDFGISKFNQLSDDGGFSMTRTGAVMGTPYYMAPEQARGANNVDHRTDLYAVGVILYECITGAVPFHAETFNQLLFKIALEDPRPIRELAPDCDPGFATIVTRAMARDPGHRFQSALELQQALQSLVQTQPIPETERAPAVPPVQIETAQAAGPAVNNTGGTWANTQGNAARKRSSKGLIAVAIGVVVFGGGAAALALRSGHAPVSAASTTTSSPLSGASLAGQNMESSPPPSVSAGHPAVVVAPDTASAPPAVSASTVGSSTASPTPSANPTLELAAKPSLVAPTRTTPRAPEKVAPKPTSASKPAATNSPGSSSGRKFRTTL